MTNFYYRSTHTPTGRTFVFEMEYSSRLQFLEGISRWNRQGDTKWVYWEICAEEFFRDRVVDGVVA